MADLQPPPTWAEVATVDEKTGRTVFNPIWLNWFLELVQVLNGSGGTALDHNLLNGLQGGGPGEFYHLTQARYNEVTGSKQATFAFMGPVSGPDAPPEFRAIQATDLPAGTGTVTSITAGTGLTGGTITTTGTIALDIPVTVPHGGTGFASYTVGDILYADSTTTLAKLADVATKQVLVSGGVGVAPAWSPNLPLSGDLSVEGNTTLGNASGDTLTVNTGTWTIGNNFVSTRAAGAFPAGTTIPEDFSITGTGDSGGTSVVVGERHTLSVSGANAFSQTQGSQLKLEHGGSNTITTGITVLNNLSVISTGNITTASASRSNFTLSSSGSITTGDLYLANTPTLSSTGAITTLNGFRSADVGHATLVTNAIGHKADDITASATLTVGFESAVNSGTGKWGFRASGTANNAFAGNVRIGSTTAPTVALDITGSLIVSNNTTLGDAVGDSLTINAGTWTIGAGGFTATLAAGTVAAGIVNLQAWNPTATGDSGGTSDIRFNGFNAIIAGANAITTAYGQFSTINHTGSATITTLIGGLNSITLSATGAATNTRGFQTTVAISSSGTINRADGFLSGVPTLTSTGAITTLNGFRAANLGHATLVTNAIGFKADDMTGAATLTAAFQSAMTSGTGKWGFYATGTADNFFEGIINIGATGSAANNAQTVTVGNVGPGGAGVSIQSWQKVKDSGGNTRYIPLFG